MKINFPSLFQTSLSKYRFFFIFGNEEEMFERISIFLQKKLSFPLHMITEKELLTSSSSQISLFDDPSTPSLTFVSSVTDKLLTHLDYLKEGTFIFTSEKARAQSKLVTYFTQSPCSLAIAAYSSPIVMSEFDFLTSEMDLPMSFKDLLFKAYQNDYRGLLGALEKIKLFGKISEDHYYSFLTPAFSTTELTPLLHAFLLKDSKKVVETFSLLNSADLILFLRTIGRAFQALFELMPFRRSPASISWQKLALPIFFKDQPIYQAALSKWQKEEILSFLESLLSLEEKIKYRSFTPSQTSHDLLRFLKS